MPVFAIRIVKREKYAGAEREMGNTYHFSTQPLEPFPDLATATFIADQEKLITSNVVEFIRWESWGPTDGSDFENVMRDKQPLTGFGSGSSISNMYREAAVVVAWPIPRSPTTNRRRWLRKFIRCPGVPGASDAVVAGADPMTTLMKAPFLTYANEVRSPPSLGLEDSLCTEQGVEPNAASIVRDYLTTRDIGR